MNARQVKIQNIIALHKSHGERGFPISENDRGPVTRLLEYVQSLVKLTERKHLEELDQETENELVSRLILNEFSLYTKQALTVEDYKRFIQGVNEIAATLPPNIHLVLATLPVIWTDGKQYNVGLHVQSPRKKGSNPKLHHFYKRTPARSDPKYERESFFDRYELYDIKHDYRNASTMYSPEVVLADTVITTKNQYKGAIRVKTAEGSSFIVAIEICLEHHKGLAIADTKSLIAALKGWKVEISDKASHIVSSDTICLQQEKLIGKPTHADWIFSKTDKAQPESFRSTFGDRTNVFVYPPEVVEGFKNVEVSQIPGILPPVKSTREKIADTISTLKTGMHDSITKTFSSPSPSVEKPKSKVKLNLKDYSLDRKNLNFGSGFYLYGSVKDNDRDVKQGHGLPFFSTTNLAAIEIKQTSHDELTKTHSEAKAEVEKTAYSL